MAKIIYVSAVFRDFRQAPAISLPGHIVIHSKAILVCPVLLVYVL